MKQSKWGAGSVHAYNPSTCEVEVEGLPGARVQPKLHSAFQVSLKHRKRGRGGGRDVETIVISHCDKIARYKTFVLQSH